MVPPGLGQINPIYFPGRPGELDCADFPLRSGVSAQDVLNADRSDPYGLDGDRDGAACEERVVSASQNTAKGGDDGQLASTGAAGVATLLGLGGVLLLFGGAALLMTRRRRNITD